MRYLDAIEIESPDHTQIGCMAPECERLVPHNEAWQIAITYRHLENYDHRQTMIALCCSRACCETIARVCGGDDANTAAPIIKMRDHDAESARLLKQLRELLGH